MLRTYIVAASSAGVRSERISTVASGGAFGVDGCDGNVRRVDMIVSGRQSQRVQRSSSRTDKEQVERIRKAAKIFIKSILNCRFIFCYRACGFALMLLQK